MGKGTCTIDGCDTPVTRRLDTGECEYHYRARHRAGRPACTVGGCETQQHVLKVGLCLKHYHRMRSWGTTDDPDPKPLKGPCSVDGCADTVKSRGMCGKHYANDQRKKYGQCREDDCESGATTRRGWCAKHYWRFLNHGTPDHEPEPRRKQALVCTVDDCGQPTRAREMCGTHYKRFMTWGSTDHRPVPKTRLCRHCRRRLTGEKFSMGDRICLDCHPEYRQEQNARRLSRASGVRMSAAKLRVSQQGRCAICGVLEAEASRGRFHLDHDHDSMAVRGLLCGNCNTGLGHFKDDPSRLRAAIKYLYRAAQVGAIEQEAQ